MSQTGPHFKWLSTYCSGHSTGRDLTSIITESATEPQWFRTFTNDGNCFRTHLESTLKVSLITSLLYFNFFLFATKLSHSLIILIHHICLFPKIKHSLNGGRYATVWTISKKKKKSFHRQQTILHGVSEMVWVIVTACQSHCLEVNELYLYMDICMTVPKPVILVSVCVLSEYRRHEIPSCCCYNKWIKRNSQVASGLHPRQGQKPSKAFC